MTLSKRKKGYQTHWFSSSGCDDEFACACLCQAKDINKDHDEDVIVERSVPAEIFCLTFVLPRDTVYDAFLGKDGKKKGEIEKYLDHVKLCKMIESRERRRENER